MAVLKNIVLDLALSFILITSMSPAFGISVFCGTNDVSSYANYNLDISTTLTEGITLGDGMISRTSHVIGSGDNELNYQTNGNGDRVNGAIKSSGNLSMTTSTIASGEETFLSQYIAGSGDLTTLVSSSSADTAAIQQANIVDGTLYTKQTAISSEIALASQDTKLKSKEGSIIGRALGKENYIDVSGNGFAGDTIDVELQSTAANKASIGGYISSEAGSYLDRNDLDVVASNENVNMGTSYLLDNGELGTAEFVVSATNLDGNNRFLANSPSISVTQAALYEPPYALTGASWKSNPYIQFYVNPSNKPSNIGSSNFLSALTCSYQTWDSASSQGLFGGLGSTARAPLKKDGTNVIGWQNFDSTGLLSNGIAATRWWNTYGVTNGKGRTVEADITFNSQLSWSTNPTTGQKDIRSTSLHEFGHVLGLKDLNSITNSDKVMYYKYTGIKRNLAAGDISGIKELYP